MINKPLLLRLLLKCVEVEKIIGELSMEFQGRLVDDVIPILLDRAVERAVDLYVQRTEHAK